VLPHFETGRVKASTTLLANDLQRQGGLQINYEDNMRIPGRMEPVGPAIMATRSDGRHFLIALTGPLTPEVAADPGMRDYALGKVQSPLIFMNELLVRGNLPAATREVQIKIGES